MGSDNPRSILLPVSLKDMKKVRTIKIMTAAQARNLKGFKINQANIINKPIQVRKMRNLIKVCTHIHTYTQVNFKDILH